MQNNQMKGDSAPARWKLGLDLGAGAIRKRESGLTAFHSKEEVPNMEHGLRNYWATVLRRVFSATKRG